MPKRRSSITTEARYKAKAFAIAKAMGVSDDLAKSKATSQYDAWYSGRLRYANIAKDIRVELRSFKNIPTTLYGTIIAYASWVHKVVVKEKLMSLDDAVEEGAVKFGLNKALSDVQFATVKDIVKSVLRFT